MNCPNCQADFSLWESFKLSNVFRVICSSCSDEIVKDTEGFTDFRSSILSVMSCGFLTVAFFGGSVMGLSVAALGLLGLGGLYYFFGAEHSEALHGFAMGASVVALFSRVGGGMCSCVR